MRKIAMLVMVVMVLTGITISAQASDWPVSDKESILIAKKLQAEPESLLGKRVKVQGLFWRLERIWLDYPGGFPSSQYSGFFAHVQTEAGLMGNTAILYLFIPKQKVSVLYNFSFHDKITVYGTVKWTSVTKNTAGIDVDDVKVGWQ